MDMSPLIVRRRTALQFAGTLAVTSGICVAVATAGPAPRAAGDAHADHTCLPLGGLLVDRTIRRQIGNRNEVTERLGGGVYRVTRCSLKGKLIRSMEVEPVRDPDGGFVLAPAMVVEGKRMRVSDYGDPRDPTWAKEWRRVRAKVAAAIMAATPGDARRDPAFAPGNATGSAAGVVARAAAVGECDDGAYVKTGSKWKKGSYQWRWNDKSFGYNYDTRDQLKAAHGAWAATKNNCHLDDITKISPPYAGTTGKHTGKYDGTKTVDKGNIDSIGCAGAIACTLIWREGNTTVEADMRFSDKVKWSNTGASGKYDYRSVATHEVGHTLGLADLRNNPNLTMYYGVAAGSTKWRTLGRGDIKGLRALYP